MENIAVSFKYCLQLCLIVFLPDAARYFFSILWFQTCIDRWQEFAAACSKFIGDRLLIVFSKDLVITSESKTMPGDFAFESRCWWFFQHRVGTNPQCVFTFQGEIGNCRNGSFYDVLQSIHILRGHITRDQHAQGDPPGLEIVHRVCVWHGRSHYISSFSSCVSYFQCISYCCTESNQKNGVGMLIQDPDNPEIHKDELPKARGEDLWLMM